MKFIETFRLSLENDEIKAINQNKITKITEKIFFFYSNEVMFVDIISYSQLNLLR